ncbi:cellulose-binding domain-containing protein, partial [Saccharothrix sp. NRRL B-16314]|uniref:cellulose-binding domain-containing protein n=1 Tax=Saccharothrix sp. NRRL B-16314 TaxID=1463825 RepID=UPI0018CBF44A
MSTRKSRSARWAATVSAVASVTAMSAALVVAGGPTASAAVGCRVDYVVAGQWNGGFGANVTVTNLGDAVSGWTLEWAFSAGQRVDQGWSGEFSQSGSTVTVRNTSWNGSLGTGASVTPGFNGSWSGSNPAPTSFKLNGVTCTGSPTSTSTSSSTSSSTTTSTTTPTTSSTTTTTPGGGGDGSGSWPSDTGSVHQTTTKNTGT